MARSTIVLLLTATLGLLPIVHDVCGPECAMGETPVLVAVGGGGIAPQDADAACPLHPAEEQAPARESDGCTHAHGTVKEAPESPSALAPSVLHSLDLPVAAFSSAGPRLAPVRRNHVLALPPGSRAPARLALRI